MLRGAQGPQARQQKKPTMVKSKNKTGKAIGASGETRPLFDVGEKVPASKTGNGVLALCWRSVSTVIS